MVEHYIELRLYYREIETHEPLYVSLAELSDVLYSSTRNVKRHLKHMEEEGLIEWRSGGGRGKRSALVFKKPLEEVFPPYFREFLQQGKYKEAIRSIKRDGVPAGIRKSCYNEMMKELSMPVMALGTAERDNNRTYSEKLASKGLTPAVVSTETGKWMIVDEEQSDPRKKGTEEDK
ncbi:SgrR family transcriptional regulator [Salinithrix halophila]